ncbi:MAG: hypothetical protein IKA36_00515 [Clostridia bacterium]|nr:hypothetical protein [Clostridia bacterium]
MKIEEMIEIDILMKYYGNMLTDKQKEIIDLYINNNLSLSEVSENLSISRQAVKDSIDTAVNNLREIEKKLGFIDRDARIKDFIEKIKDNNIDTMTRLELLSLLDD